MKQLFQNNFELEVPIQEEGCKFICILNIIQDITNYEFSSQEVNSIYDMSIAIKDWETGKPYMREDCFVNSVEGISQIASGVSKVSVYLKEVSSKEHFNFRLAYFTRTTNGGKFVGHFVEVERHSNKVIGDPWKGGSKTARIGTIDSYRNIHAKLL